MPIEQIIAMLRGNPRVLVFHATPGQGIEELIERLTRSGAQEQAAEQPRPVPSFKEFVDTAVNVLRARGTEEGRSMADSLEAWAASEAPGCCCPKCRDADHDELVEAVAPLIAEQMIVRGYHTPGDQMRFNVVATRTEDGVEFAVETAFRGAQAGE